MTFQPVPDTVEATIEFDYDGQSIFNVLHFKEISGYDVAAVQTLAETVGDWVVNTYLPTCGARTKYVSTKTKGLNSAVDVQGIHTSGAGTAGSHSFSEPLNVTKAITFSSGMTGRNARGRMFHAGLPNDALTDPNHVTQDWVDDVIDALELLKLAVEALSWVWVIVSRYVDSAKRTTAVTYPVTSFSTSNLTTDSARGRLPKT
jgi:hypothetical protein